MDKAVCPTDGRVTYAVLTQAGSRTLANASGAHLAALRTVFEERYTRTELATLAELLARLSGPAGGARKRPIRIAREPDSPRSWEPVILDCASNAILDFARN